MAIIDMDSLQGVIDKNGLYLHHADLSHVHITVNGPTIYKVRSSFPHHASKLFYTTLDSLGLNTRNSLIFDAFNKGQYVSLTL